MLWKLGSPVRIATPEGEVYISPAVHFHSQDHAAFFTRNDSGGVMPFVVTDDFLKADDFSDRLEQVSIQLFELGYLLT